MNQERATLIAFPSGGQPEPPPDGGQPTAVPPPRRRRRLRFRARRAHRPRSRFGRICAILIEVVFGVLALLLVGCGFLFWRVVEGPVSLDFLTPLMVEAFDADAIAGNQATITGTRLLWDDRRQSLELQVTGLAFDDEKGQRSFTLPLLNIDFSFGRLLEGKVEVTDIEIAGARLAVRRTSEGDFEVLLFQQGAEAPEGRPLDAHPVLTQPGRAPPVLEGEKALTAINALLSGGDLGPIRQLQKVSLVYSQIVVDDQVLGFTWTLPARHILLERTAAGLSGEIDVTLPFGKQQGRAGLAFVYDKTSGTLDVAGQLSGLDLAALPTLLPQVRGLSVVASELSGDISATLGQGGHLFFVDFELAAGPGELRPGYATAPPVPITGGRINGRIDLAAPSLHVYEARIDTGTKAAPGPQIGLALEVTRPDGGGWSLKASTSATPFHIRNLAWLWPSAYGSGAHSWVVENITDGMVENLRADASFALGADGAVSRSLSGSFDFTDLTLHYLRPLPAMEGLTGSARVEGDRMDFAVESGHSAGLALGPGSVTIYDLARELPRIEIAVPAEGSVADMLAILDEPPLGLISKAGIDRRGAQGRGRVAVAMGFPLLEDLTSDDVALKVTGQFRDVLLRRLVLGLDLAAERVSLASDMQALTARGGIEVAGSRLEADLDQSFAGRMDLSLESDRLLASTAGHLVPAMKERLGGSLAGRFRVVGDPVGRLEVDVDADLTATVLDLPLIRWQKPAGERAAVTASVVLDRGLLHSVALERLDGEGRSVAGDFVFDAKGQFLHAEIDHFMDPNMQLRDVRIEESSGALRLAVGGGEVDARQWIREVRLPSEPSGDRPGAEPSNTVTDISFDRLQSVLLPDGALRDVKGAIRLGPEGTRVELEGRLQEGGGDRGAVRVGYVVEPGEPKQATIALDDAGALLRAMQLTDVVAGGRFSYRGRSPAGDPEGAIVGTVTLRDFRVTRVPEGLKVLMVAGLTGIGEAMEGEGVAFDLLTGDLSWDGGRLASRQLRAVGSALGVLASGGLDIGADTIDLSGKIVPAYAINRFLNSIPLVGWVITGGEDQGLFAISYQVSDSLHDPRITVNPLSALTPPILRSLVELVAEAGGSDGASPAVGEPRGPQR